MDFYIIERLGGACRCVTLFTFAIHFLHALFSVVNYLAWVRQDTSHVAPSTKHAYLAMTVVCCVFYFFGASVFYMWAWRFPEPEEIAKRRRVYGVIINAIFCDIPMFVVETTLVWSLRFAAAIQGFTYVLTCISLCYSLLRVWFFFMVRVIKFRPPSAARLGANYPALSSVVRRDLDEAEYNNRATGMRGNTPDRRGGSENDRAFLSDMNEMGVGNTILLNRNAAHYSDDAASSGMCTPAGPDRVNRGEAYYGPSSRYVLQSERFNDVEEQPRQGYYGRASENMDQPGLPFRI
ncbi:hypothetical protein ABB37_00351 [Leptomonas pyrrhocoris]|uniref:Transmembrane protein n=1 Tax=Leptomonas pyrrhocoris TaxID=157538 RepID=A0A0N0E065_LEPPY|nr:hypothetical protein ABB37_00351 [Leptomonas pyrrhocoris]KPA86085.1 hypothetical protein ABB37_00351 [Leptomonas pyrrhocoris]|eukprot:XP_015664524.1 hypothetical protein ABB37_00351 [Leptomonas pyrrhocoris]